jgi:hypothetical protein
MESREAKVQFMPWERTADGAPAQLKSSQKPVTRGNIMLKRMALAKMTDITLLSAEFQGNVVLFEPRVSILQDMGTHVEFRGLYQVHRDDEDSQEAPIQSLPSLALRQASWIRDNDFQQFNRATNKRAYIESEQQVHAHITFTTPALQPEIYRLLEDARSLTRAGIQIEPVVHPDYQREEIRFCVDDEELRFTLSYLPHLRQAPILERWIAEWMQSFAQVNFSEGILPDHGCSISYSHSLMELFNRFPG